LQQNKYLELTTSGFICWNYLVKQATDFYGIYRAGNTQAAPHFITSDLWPSLSSYDLDAEDYKVWAWYRSASHSGTRRCWPEVAPGAVWTALQQHVIDQWRGRLRACVRADERHLKHLLW